MKKPKLVVFFALTLPILAAFATKSKDAFVGNLWYHEPPSGICSTIGNPGCQATGTVLCTGYYGDPHCTSPFYKRP